MKPHPDLYRYHGHSAPRQVPIAVAILRMARAHTIVDLGCGCGYLGYLMRRMAPSLRLIGIEGCPQYLGQPWHKYYDEVRLQRIEDYEPIDGAWHAVVDSIEHLYRENALELLGRLDRAVVGTPIEWYEQGALNGNSLETHRSLLTEQDFAPYGYQMVRNYYHPHHITGRPVMLATFVKGAWQTRIHSLTERIMHRQSVCCAATPAIVAAHASDATARCQR